MTDHHFSATVLGLPRIGPNRELKRAIETYWASSTASDKPAASAELAAVGAELRRTQWRALGDAGLDSIPINTFSYYDQMLDTAVLLGAIPTRFDSITDPLDRYFAAARGTESLAPLEMTKWFDTNYHYLVPEIAPDTRFSLHPDKVLDELGEALSLGVAARPVIIGPITFLALSKSVDGAGDPLDRLPELIPLYLELLESLAAAGAGWVQLDEPILVTELGQSLAPITAEVYTELANAHRRPRLLVGTYFGSAGPNLAALADTEVEAVAVDFLSDPSALSAVVGVPALRHKLLVAGVVDGRNVWRANLENALADLTSVLGSVDSIAVSSSCSLLHVPYSREDESGDDPVWTWMAFGAEKVAEVVALSRALREGRQWVAAEFAAALAAQQNRDADERRINGAIRARLDALVARGSVRAPAAERAVAQSAGLNLPLLPTTTIGSFPQTSDIRRARAAWRAGRIDDVTYTDRMREEIRSVIELQEQLGLDVLVHGEPERNDMVQYFAEKLDGFVTTNNGWVQSYGTRCVRPPILFGDVSRAAPMTVEWSAYAQTLTQRPVKGMLTGPVTILAWSFVRDDQPLAESAAQIALAIRDETVDLQAAGISIIQVDEPALRELLPLRSADRAAYLDWATESFRLATSGVADSTQIHTHLCYSEFGDIIGAIADLDADVTSIEAARSRMEVLADLDAAGFANQIGPGVYDIHSPRVPDQREIENALRSALDVLTPDRLWVNPDCGLKTRGRSELVKSLQSMVAAATAVRAQ